jgi:hypothetical protein
MNWQMTVLRHFWVSHSPTEVPSPAVKAEVCKNLHPRFKSGRRLQLLTMTHDGAKIRRRAAGRSLPFLR